MTNHLSHPKYRPDIDGLRAIAVLSVVAFHAFPNWVKGGFIGVDVFFVISGYLISTIIFENLDKGTFSFKEFYSRRIRRIFPALLLVLTVSFVVGWFTLLTDEYKQLGKHIVGGAGFISNIFLWGESGYFDNAAETKPLLHLWSLGVEEQFYIIYPLLIWFAWKRQINILTLTIALAIVSLYMNIKGIKHDAVATFYSPQTRFWELMCGSLLAWVVLYKKETFKDSRAVLDKWLSIAIYRAPRKFDGSALANFAAFMGLLLLVYGFLKINKELSFPGKWALVPVLGSILIIIAGQHAWVNRKILSNHIVVWFGLISFPLYLWHWVMLTFMRIYEGEIPSKGLRVVVVIVSIFFAWFTYKFVETPLRHGGGNKVKVSILIILMSTIAAIGYSSYKEDGMQFRGIVEKFRTYSDSIKVTDRKSECFEIAYAYKKQGEWFCNLGDQSLPATYFAYGDSHALSLLPAIELFAKDNGINIQFTGTSGCPSLLGVQSMRGEADIDKYNCQKLNERVFDHVKNSQIKNVLLINRWTYYTGSEARPNELNLISRNPAGAFDKDTSKADFAWAVKNTINRYKDIGVNVIFVEDNPQQLFNPKDILRKGNALESNYIKYSVSFADHARNQKFVNEILRDQSNNVINFDDVLCNLSNCPLVLNSHFLYADDDHLSIDGAKVVYPKFSTELKRLGS